MLRAALLSCVVSLLCTSADAQAVTASQARAQDADPSKRAARLDRLPDCDQNRLDQVGDHLRYSGNVECTLPDGVRVFADVIDLYARDDGARIAAAGNVVFTSGEGHIASERLEYDTMTGLGTFENATAALENPGAGPVLVPGTQVVVYFQGERPEPLPHHEWRLDDVRAADAAVGSAQREHDRQSGRLCHRTEHGHAGEERAGVLVAVFLLPDSE